MTTEVSSKGPRRREWGPKFVPTRHARLGASSAHRWMKCPGSVRLAADIEDTSSPYAREGTAAHEIAAMALKDGEDPLTYVGMKMQVEDEVIEVTAEMVDAVKTYVEHVRRRAVKTGSVRIEERFDLSPLDPPEPMFGTADAVCWDRNTKHLYVEDYKHGQGVVVDPEENPQLLYYALGAVVALKVKPEKITLTITQPRARNQPSPHRSWTTNWDELATFKKALFAAAHRAQKPNAPLEPGEWCKFCPARAICPAQRQMAIAVAQTEFDAERAVLPAAPQLSEEELVRVMRYKSEIEDWLKAVEQYVKNKLENGEEFPGWKLVEKRAYRRWENEDDALKYLQRKVGKKKSVKEKVLSPAQAEKMLKVELGEVPEHLETLWTSQSSGYNLAPEDDPRPAVNLLSNAQDEFEADVEVQVEVEERPAEEPA